MGLFPDKYFFVDGDSISVALLTTGGYGRKYGDRISAADIFLANGITKEYQKIVLIVPFMKSLFNRMRENAVSKLNSFYAQEFISEVQFCSVPNDELGEKRLLLTNVPFEGCDYADLISIDSSIQTCSLDDIKQFFYELKSKKLIEGYFGALTQLFSESKTATSNLKEKKAVYSLGSIEKALKM